MSKMDEKEYLGRYISQIYRNGRNRIGYKFGEKGVGSGQIMFLKQLYKKDGINQEELSKQLSVDKATTARAIKKLEESGFVIRQRDDKDKRSYIIHLTEKSMQVKVEINKVVETWENQILQPLEEEEKDLFMKMLRKVCLNDNIKGE